MSPQRKSEEPEATIVPEGDDAEDPRTFSHEDAEAVRNGELSAAQLSGGNGNVDPSEPDAQYPPGVVQNLAPLPDAADVRAMVPDRRTDVQPITTDASPEYDR